MGFVSLAADYGNFDPMMSVRSLGCLGFCLLAFDLGNLEFLVFLHEFARVALPVSALGLAWPEFSSLISGATSIDSLSSVQSPGRLGFILLVFLHAEIDFFMPPQSFG